MFNVILRLLFQFGNLFVILDVGIPHASILENQVHFFDSIFDDQTERKIFCQCARNAKARRRNMSQQFRPAVGR